MNKENRKGRITESKVDKGENDKDRVMMKWMEDGTRERRNHIVL